MRRIYVPDRNTITRISAEESHGPGVEYVVSSGVEKWGNVEVKVCKVQMAFNGKIQGRKCPSYPTKEDFERVFQALQELY